MKKSFFELPMLPYIAPYAVFVLLGYIAVYFGTYSYFLYPVKAILTACLLYYWSQEYTEIRFSFSFLAAAGGIGCFFIWIGLTECMPFVQLHPPAHGYCPIKNNLFLTSFLVMSRLGGAILIVPVFEELFIRSFLLRFITNPDDFTLVPIGKYTLASFIVINTLFMVAHKPWEWPAAFVVSCVYTLLLYRRKQIFDCILAHAITNACLGIYVLTTGNWGYW